MTSHELAQFPAGEVGRTTGVLRYVYEPLIAPLSGRPCAAYLVSIDIGSKRLRQSDAVDFIIDGSTASAFVDVSGALLLLTDERRVDVAPDGAGSARVEEYHPCRTHLSLGKDSPAGREVERPEMGDVIEWPVVGGLHHRYTRRAG